MQVLTREVISQYLAEYPDRGVALAALVEDFALEEDSPFHRQPRVDILLEDFHSYKEG